jgi:hypothetical protein
MWHVLAAEELHPGFWWEKPTEGEHLEDLGIDRRIIMRWILKNWVGEARTGLIWLRLGRGVERL